MKKHKNIAIVITTGLLIALAVALLVLFTGSAVILTLLKNSIFIVLGTFLAVIGAVMTLRGGRMTLIYWGIGLLALGLFVPFLRDITALSIFGG